MASSLPDRSTATRWHRPISSISSDEITITDDALRAVISGYTREAGVRSLERELGTLLRKVAAKIATATETPVELALPLVAGAWALLLSVLVPPKPQPLEVPEQTPSRAP